MSFISIVIPVYFNEQSLPLLLERLDALASAQSADQFEFIFVDDGSGDNSLAVLSRLAEQDKRVRVVRLSRNFGSNAAILAGLSYARGDCAAFIAADLQDPPEQLPEMIRLWKGGAEVVLAVRKDRRGDPFLTRVFAMAFNTAFATFVFKGMSPQGVGFFLIDRRVVDVVVETAEKNAHLIGLILWSGFRRAVVEYDRVERQHGRSRWTFGKKLNYFVDAFVAFTYLPLRISSALGVLLSIAGAIYAAIVLVARLMGNIPVEGWTALMIVVLLASGTQLLMLGVIGEYLWRNLDATRRRPPFIVASLLNVPATRSDAPQVSAHPGMMEPN
ncbi:MAG: glycosyltransferase family 2 protein [Anaerolineae bacterium]